MAGEAERRFGHVHSGLARASFPAGWYKIGEPPHDGHDRAVEQREDLADLVAGRLALQSRMLRSTIVVVNEDQQARRGFTSDQDDLRGRVDQLEGELEGHRE